MNVQIRISSPTRHRVIWDDENPDWGYKCRTQFPGFRGPDNPPAVNRFAPGPLPLAQEIGDYRVDISAWEQPFRALNNDTTGRLFGYWTDPNLAQFNDKGFPLLAYLLFSGNEIRGERVGDWFRFVTLTPSDADRVQGMTINTHPHLVHRFTCVTWKVVDGIGFTLHINSTGTPKGDLFYYVVTKDGYGFIPWRHIKEI